MDERVTKFDLQLFNDAGEDAGGSDVSEVSSDASTVESVGMVDNNTAESSETTGSESIKDYSTAGDKFLEFIDSMDDEEANEVDEVVDNANDEVLDKANETQEETETSTDMPDVFNLDDFEPTEQTEESSNLDNFRKLFKAEEDSSTDEVKGGDKETENASEGEEVEAEAEADEPEGELNKMTKEELMDKFYEDPEAMMDDLVSERVNAILSQKESEQSQKQQKVETLKKSFDNFTEKYPDFTNYKDVMMEIIDNPELGLKGNPNAYEISYHLSRSLSHDEIPTPPTGEEMLDTVLNDEQLVEKILSNEDIKSKVVTSYLNNLDSKKNVATIRNSSNKGKNISNPKKKAINSFDDAEDALLQEL